MNAIHRPVEQAILFDHWRAGVKPVLTEWWRSTHGNEYGSWKELWDSGSITSAEDA